MVLTASGALAPINLAKFALSSHAAGVALTMAKFTDPKTSLVKQWERYFRQECGNGDLLGLDITCVVDDEKVQVVVEAASYLKTFRLKPVIEHLNGAMAGLGWFVYDAVSKIASHRYPMYHIRDLGSFCEMLWHNGHTKDADLAAELKLMDGLSSNTNMKKMRELYQFPWPSDIDADVDGHKWMLDGSQRSPKTASHKEAQAFVKANAAAPDLVAVVKSSLALLEHVQDAENSLANAPQEELFEGDGDGDGEYCGDDYQPNRIGGSCVVVWDKATLMYEAMNHYEELELNGGEATTTHFVFRADASSDAHLETTVKRLQSLVRHHALAGRLLQHFPKE